MNATLDFPPLDTAAPATTTTALATKPAADIAPLSIKDTVLAQFRATEPGLIQLADKYRRVAFDCATTKGLDNAKAARLDLRENGRYAVQRAEKRIKAEVNDLKATMAEEAARLIAIIEPVEAHVDGQIKAREEQIAAEKAERERIAAEAAAAAAAVEAARKARHEAGLARIASYVTLAAGKTSSQIAAGISFVQETVCTDLTAWEEYAGQAQAALDATLAALRTLHADTLAREEREAEAARVAAENARVAAENARIAAELAEQRRAIEEQAAALRAQQQAAEAEIAALKAEQAREAQRQADMAAAALRDQEAARAQRQADELAAIHRHTLQSAQEIAEKMPECVESGGIDADAAKRIMGLVATITADTAIEQAKAADSTGIEALRAATPYADAGVAALLASVPEEITPEQDAPQVLKAEPATADATDRATPATTSPSDGSMGAGQAAVAAPVAEVATLTIGAINDRLRCCSVTGAQLSALGIVGVKAAKGPGMLFTESQYRTIVCSLRDCLHAQTMAVDFGD
jgi:hypothetical protein